MKIAIIPARGGSKRIKNKNIKTFYGKPIISYAIKCAKDSKLFDKIIVSSDSKKIVHIAKKYGAEAPFMRPKSLSKDGTHTIEVIKHAIRWLINKGNKVKYVCCIYPATPLMMHSDLRNSFKLIKRINKNFLISAAEYPYPVEKGFYLKNNRVKLFQPNKHSKSSHLLKRSFHDAGQFYWAKTKTWLKKKSILNSNSYIYKVPQLRSQDVDTISDWKIIEKLYKIKSK